MKSKIDILLVAIMLLLFSNWVIASESESEKPSQMQKSEQTVRTIQIIGSYNLTYPTNTSPECLDELKQNGCASEGCSPTVLRFAKCQNITLTFQAGMGSQCGNTQAEIFLGSDSSTYDVSLVNGFNKMATISADQSPSITANSSSALGNGIYPYGCDTCTSRTNSPCPSTLPCNSGPICQITDSTSKNFTITFS